MSQLALLEGSAAILGLLQGVLVMLNYRCNWIVYCLQQAALICFSLLSALYGDCANCAVYFAIGVWGFAHWGKRQGRTITSLQSRERLIAVLLTAISIFAVYSFLKTTDDPLPLLDAITTVTGFMATICMALRKLDAWIIWLVNDILYVIQYFLLPNQALMLCLLNVVWTALALLSFLNWKRIMDQERQAESCQQA